MVRARVGWLLTANAQKKGHLAVALPNPLRDVVETENLLADFVFCLFNFSVLSQQPVNCKSSGGGRHPLFEGELWFLCVNPRNIAIFFTLLELPETVPQVP